MSVDEADGSDTDGAEGERLPGTEGAESDADGSGTTRIATAVRLGAWIVGPLLIILGAFGMATAPVASATYVVLGLFVTPRTRREIKELCRIWVGTDADA